IEHKVREKFVQSLSDEFSDLNLRYAIGGQISFDVFPQGWDKTFCLQFVGVDISNGIPSTKYDQIYFFGDKTHPGGNDFEIFSCPLITGISVVNPDDTMEKLKSLFDLE